MANDNKTYELVAQPRTITGKANGRIRRRGLVPAVMYGHEVQSQSIQVRKKEFDHVYLRAGSTTLVDLAVGDAGKARKVFIHEVQRNPVNNDVKHIDFMVVNLLEEMSVSVPVVLVGESPIVAKHEGLLLHMAEHIMLKALPMNIPSTIEADISGLTEIDQAIHVSDLKLPDNVTLLSSEDELVAKITEMPLAEEIEVAEEEAAEAAEGAGEAGAEGGES